MLKIARFMETVSDIRALPVLADDQIHIWGLHVPEMAGRMEALHARLSEQEQAKAARFRRAADRQSSVSARGALRILLSGYTGVAAQEITFQYAENGKPHVADLAVDFNVSHSGDWVVLAFGRGRNIGVDVEKIKWELDVEAIAARFFSAAETALIQAAADQHTVFFQLWARKEAYVKARGSGLFRGLSHFTVPIENGALPETGESDGWIFQRLEAGTKYASAVVTDKMLGGVPCYDFGGLKWDS